MQGAVSERDIEVAALRRAQAAAQEQAEVTVSARLPHSTGPDELPCLLLRRPGAAAPARLGPCSTGPGAQARDYNSRMAQLQLEFQAMLKEVLAAAQGRLDAAHSAEMLGQRGGG